MHQRTRKSYRYTILPKVSSRVNRYSGILGDKLVTINMGDSDCTIIEDGEFIFAEEAIDIEYAKKVTSIVNRLDSIGRKVILCLNRRRRRKTSKSIAHSVQEMEGMLTEVKEGNGLIHALLYDKKPPRTSRRASTISTVQQHPSTLPWKHLKKVCVAHDLIWNQWACSRQGSPTAATTLDWPVT